MYSRIWFIVLLSIGFNETYSQMEITFPVSRVVFQRDNQNTASFNVAGDYSVELDKVDARLIPMQVGQGESTDWQTISTVAKGIFSGTITGKGGWYKLEVRGFKSGSVVIETSLDRVGIGEVFLVAGQSNAEGQLTYPGAEIGTTEDRVSCIDFVEYVFDENLLPFKFSQLGNFTKLGPYNPVPWYWARLGEKLCKKLNVPVLFYGNALGGSSVEWWAQSANGVDLRQQHPLFIKVAGMPYRGMQGSLQHYASRTGIRAVLWHQGESDVNMPSQDYFKFLKTIIEKSRKDVEHDNLTWVVARVGNVSGQNQVASQVPNVYQGPNTDESIPDIPQFRYIGHFANEGLNLAASIWFESLNDAFFKNSTPKNSTPLLPLTIECANGPSNQIELRPIDGLNNYRWTDGNFSKNRAVQEGKYICRAQNNSGFAYFTQSIAIDQSFFKIPSIRINGPTGFCENTKPSVLSVDVSNNIRWNTNELSSSIIPQTSGTYFVTRRNIYGCSYESNAISVDIFPVPKVNIIANKETAICQGDSITLFADNDFTSYQWSTGDEAKSIKVKKTDEYSLKVKNNFGCESITANLKVEVKENVEIPEIIRNGIYYIEAKNLNSKLSADYYIWTNNSEKINDKEAILKTKESGIYAVKAVKEYTLFNNKKLICYSPFSKNITIEINFLDKFGIYPNPSEDGKIYLEALDETENVKIQIYDLKGFLYYETNIDKIDKKIKLDLSSFPPNNYILKLNGLNINESKRFILR